MDILPFMIMVAYILVPSIATSSIGVSQSVSDGETLVSKGGLFELGFFSPGKLSETLPGDLVQEYANTEGCLGCQQGQPHQQYIRHVNSEQRRQSGAQPERLCCVANSLRQTRTEPGGRAVGQWQSSDKKRGRRNRLRSVQVAKL